MRPTRAVVTGDFRRRIVSLGADARGAFAILECAHKVRRRAPFTAATTTAWCKSCEHRSPFRTRTSYAAS